MIKFTKTLSLAIAVVLLAACAAATNPVVGAWDTSISTPVGEQAGVWTFNGDGTAIMSSDQGDQAIEGVMIDGNMVSFDVTIDAQGQSLSLSFSGTVEGDAMSGEFSSDFGPFAVTATRQ